MISQTVVFLLYSRHFVICTTIVHKEFVFLVYAVVRQAAFVIKGH